MPSVTSKPSMNTDPVFNSTLDAAAASLNRVVSVTAMQNMALNVLRQILIFSADLNKEHGRCYTFWSYQNGMAVLNGC